MHDHDRRIPYSWIPPGDLPRGEHMETLAQKGPITVPSKAAPPHASISRIERVISTSALYSRDISPKFLVPDAWSFLSRLKISSKPSTSCDSIPGVLQHSFSILRDFQLSSQSPNQTVFSFNITDRFSDCSRLTCQVAAI